MQRRFSRILAVVAASLLVMASGPAEAGPDDTVVAKVGARSITRGDVERRLGHIPAIQLSTYGATPAEIRGNFVQKVLVRELIFAQGAEAQKLTSREDVRLRTQDALRAALLGSLRKQSANPQAISDEEVGRYYQENKEKFQTPERIGVWRIQTATREDAQKILDEVKKAGGEARWKDVAREKSTDKTTRERGGSLGFLGPDGKSNEAAVQADPALFAAAKKVADGEICPEPVAEGKSWAVVWRRGSTPAVTRALEDESGTIRNLLARQKMEQSTREILERLRKELVRDVTTEGVNLVDISNSGEVGARKRPGVSKVKSQGKPQPTPGPGGLRLNAEPPDEWGVLGVRTREDPGRDSLEGEELLELHREHRVARDLELARHVQLHAGLGVLVELLEILVGDGEGTVGRLGAGLALGARLGHVDEPLARARDVHLVLRADGLGLGLVVLDGGGQGLVEERLRIDGHGGVPLVGRGGEGAAEGAPTSPVSGVTESTFPAPRQRGPGARIARPTAPSGGPDLRGGRAGRARLVGAQRRPDREHEDPLDGHPPLGRGWVLGALAQQGQIAQHRPLEERLGARLRVARVTRSG
jgi:peptidyl-prolyl cis-trans isomerase C